MEAEEVFPALWIRWYNLFRIERYVYRTWYVKQNLCSFLSSQRGSTIGLITSAFVLSAFFFSTVSNIFFVRDTSAFLLFLSLGTSIPMIMGFFLVPPIPLTDESASQWDDYRLGNNSRSHLLDPISTEGEDSYHNSVQNGAVYMTVNISERSDNYCGQESGPSTVTGSALLRNLQNRKVWWNGDFWLLVAILSLRTCSHFLRSLTFILTTPSLCIVNGTGLTCTPSQKKSTSSAYSLNL